MTRKPFVGFFTASLLLSAWLLAGCGAPRVYPPAFSLYGYERVAVIPFANETQDPALAREIQSEMVDQVLQVGAVPVVDANQIGAYLRSRKINPASVMTDPALMKEIADHFHADLLLVGAATGYVETLKDGVPERRTDSESGAGKWGFNTFRKVTVNAKAQLLDPASGSLVWSQKNQGYSYTNTFNPLPIPGGIRVPAEISGFMDLANLVKNRVLKKGDEEPAVIDENDSQELLYPRSQYFAKLRDDASFEVVNAIVDDFRGHGGWMPGTASGK